MFHTNGKEQRTLQFQPLLAINEYVGLATALVHGVGIGEFPPIVQPELVRRGKLMGIMSRWRFRPFHLSMVHLSNRYIAKPVRLFKDFAAERKPLLFPNLRA
jgi:DNA-binding transcriptional LysR family regulator